VGASPSPHVPIIFSLVTSLNVCLGSGLDHIEWTIMISAGKKSWKLFIMSNPWSDWFSFCICILKKMMQKISSLVFLIWYSFKQTRWKRLNVHTLSCCCCGSCRLLLWQRRRRRLALISLDGEVRLVWHEIAMTDSWPDSDSFIRSSELTGA